MKKIIVAVLALFVSFRAFANNHTIDPAKMYRHYVKTTDNIAVVVNQNSTHTVIFYVHPSLSSNPSVKSDPVSLYCNGNAFILAPGNSYACTVKTIENNGSLSFNIDAAYARNGADVSTVDIDSI